MTKRKLPWRVRSVLAREFNVQREVDYITYRAARGDSRIVTLGALVFFSTSDGDAWMLEAEHGLAYCLLRDGERRETPVRMETDQRFAVAWDSDFALEDGCFFTRSADGKLTAWPPFPAEAIQEGVRRALENRR